MLKKKESIIILIFALLIGFNLSDIHACLKNVQSRNYYKANLKIENLKSLGENIYGINSEYELDIYNQYYQDDVDQKIKTLVRHHQDDQAPLLIYNPYGTNTSSFYFAYYSPHEYTLEYTIHANDTSIPDFQQIATSTKTYDTIYASQLIGFIPNMENTLTISLKNNDTTLFTYTYEIHMPASASTVQTKLEVSELKEGQTLSNGLYAMFGLDKSFHSNIYLFDNNGILRSELLLKNDRSDRIIFQEDAMIYSYRKSGLMKVNTLGKIIDFYDFDGYKQHHEFIYDETTNKFLVLVNKNGEDTIEDYIISIDAASKEVKEVANMKVLLPELYAQARQPEEGNTYGGNELDWIHLNSMTLSEDGLLISAREVSTIIKLTDIYESSKVEYMIADPNLYKDSSYQEYIYEKEGDFISQSGQHTITYETDASLSDHQYYLYMFNNNFASSRTRQDIDWSFMEGAGTYTKGDHSYYYKYLVDENTKTYSLLEKIALPYSSIVSSTQKYDENLVTSSGMSTCFNEYDANGNLLRQFNYNAKKYAYRVFKYSFENFYFK